MSNTGQTDQGFNGDYHHDINLLLKRQEYDADTIHSLKSQVEFEMNEKGLARIKRDEYAKRIVELEKELAELKYLLGVSANMLSLTGKILNAME